MKLSDENALINSALHGRERLAEAIILLGFVVNKNYKFAIRDENTPSCHVRDNGTWRDYGDGSYGDWATLYMLKHRCGFRTAVKAGLEIFNITVNSGITEYQFSKPTLNNSSTTSKNNLSAKLPLRKSYIRFFLNQATAHKDRHEQLCRYLMPFATTEEIIKAVKQFYIGYDAKQDKLVVPVVGIRGDFINAFKYTPFTKVETWKYFISKGCVSFKIGVCNSVYQWNPKIYERPLKVKYLFGRKRTLFNLEVLQHKPSTIFIVEGEKDAINGTLDKRAAITQGGSGNWKKEFVQELLSACIYYKMDTLPRIVVVQDHDKPGVKSTIKIYSDLAEVFPNVVMAFWKNSVAKMVQQAAPGTLVRVMDSVLATQDVNLKFDYTDWVGFKKCS